MSDLAANISWLQARVPTRGSILVIEDNPAITDMICCILEFAGYQVMACAGRKAACTWLNRALEAGSLPALILLDADIPPTNVRDFLSHLRRQFSDAYLTPAILLLTTSKSFHDEFATVERVILKPFHVCDLIAEVQKIFPLNKEQTREGELLSLEVCLND